MPKRVDPTQQVLTMYTGPELKKEGQAKVIENAGEDWRRAVLHIIKECAKRFPEITADTVRLNCAERRIPEPHHCNAWGSVFAEAAKDGVITKAGRYEPSRIARNHARVLCVWRSLVEEEARS